MIKKTLPTLILTLTLFLSISFLSCGGGGGAGSQSQDPSPTVKHSTCLAIFPIKNSKFPASVALDLLSTTAAPCFEFMYDTFGTSDANINTIITSLSNLEINISVITGATRKPRRDGRTETFYPELDIDQFNQAILNDPRVQAAYKARVTAIKSQYIAPHPEISFVVIPELEDNLSDQAFGNTVNMIHEVLGELSNYRIVRNSINNRGFFGLNKEVHVISLGGLVAGDIVSLDGEYFNFSDESKPGVISYNDLKVFLKQADSMGVTVYLWRPEWQGLPDGANKLPNERNYIISHVDDIKDLLTVN